MSLKAFNCAVAHLLRVPYEMPGTDAEESATRCAVLTSRARLYQARKVLNNARKKVLPYASPYAHATRLFCTDMRARGRFVLSLFCPADLA